MNLPQVSFALCAALILLFSCKSDNRQITSDLIHFPGQESEDPNAPQITFDSIHYHFGQITIGEKIVHSYRFTNTGASPLVIFQVNPACGCTTPKDWPHDPVLPGESGEITIEFNSKGFPGKVEKTVSVLTNAIPRVWDLKLSGFVAGIEADPKKTDHGIQMEREPLRP